MSLQKSRNKRIAQWFFLGLMVALAFGGIFLYAWRGWEETYVPARFASSATIVNTYVAGLRTLETTYVEHNVPPSLDALLFRLTDMRVPEEVLDIHLRTVIAVEQMKKETLSDEEIRTRLSELFTRMRLAAEKIIL